MKVLSLSVYRHNSSVFPDMDCTNGGASGRYDEILVECDRGNERDIDPTNPPENLFKVEEMNIGFCRALHLVPYKKRREGMVGPMDGGNYADTCDSRWGEMLSDHYGAAFRFNHCLSIHDRYETPEQYRILSR